MSSTSAVTLRKSYRRILSLSPGLHVRMRTLFLPQLLPEQADFNVGEETPPSGEKKIALLIEVENAPEPLDNAFELAEVTIDIGGKGGKAAATLVCQAQDQLFPLYIGEGEQYNLLYGISISSVPDERDVVDEALQRSLGRGEDQRPVSITLRGRPRSSSGHPTAPMYPTEPFPSRWNCVLDLGPYYASLPVPHTAPTIPQVSKLPSLSPAIAGDKRYSLASLTSHPERPILPSQAQKRPKDQGPGLLISVKLLLPVSDVPNVPIKPFDVFSVEVFVHNRTPAVQEFRLNVPTADELSSRVREAWEKRRRRRPDEPTWGLDDAGQLPNPSLIAYLTISASSDAIALRYHKARAGSAGRRRPLRPSLG